MHKQTLPPIRTNFTILGNTVLATNVISDALEIRVSE